MDKTITAFNDLLLYGRMDKTITAFNDLLLYGRMDKTITAFNDLLACEPTANLHHQIKLTKVSLEIKLLSECFPKAPESWHTSCNESCFTTQTWRQFIVDASAQTSDQTVIAQQFGA
jgi:hypothetical protein